LRNWLLKFNLFYRARSALPYLPIYRSASVGRSLAGRPAGAGLLANVMRVQLCLRLAAGWGSCQTQRPHTNLFLPAKKYLFIRSVRPLCRYNIKKTCGRGNAEPLVNNA